MFTIHLWAEERDWSVSLGGLGDVGMGSQHLWTMWVLCPRSLEGDSQHSA